MSGLNLHITDEARQQKLKEAAEKHGCSMAEEVRNISRAALIKPHPPAEYAPAEQDPATSIRQRFAPLGGMELKLPSRGCDCNE